MMHLSKLLSCKQVAETVVFVSKELALTMSARRQTPALQWVLPNSREHWDFQVAMHSWPAVGRLLKTMSKRNLENCAFQFC